MMRVLLLWFGVFLLAGGALATASQYLITPIWPVNFVAAYYLIKLRRDVNNPLYIWVFIFSSVMGASVVFDHHQPVYIQLLMSGLSALQVNIFISVYYFLIKKIHKYTYKRTILLILPCFISSLIASILFTFTPVEGIWYLMFFDYFLEQLATGFAVIGILYGLSEWKKVTVTTYGIITIASLGQYFISINPLFYNCFVLPLVNVYFTIKYHFRRFVFVMGVLSFICSVYLVLPLAGQYWREEQIYLFSHLSTYRVGLASFFLIFLILSELQMHHRSLTRYLEKISFYDQLTGLKNRRFLHDKLFSQNKVIAQGAILLIDVDDFKKINDRYGHNIGDEVLTKIAKNIQEKLDRKQLAFRWGGEEFLILIKDVVDEKELKNYCEYILECCRINLSIDKEDEVVVHCSASIGVERFTNLTVVNYSRFIEKADHLLYRAKAEGKDRYLLDESKTNNHA